MNALADRPDPAASPNAAGEASAAAALARLCAVRPAIAGIVAAGPVALLSGRRLLHAGPPLRDPRRPPAVIASAAAMTAVHEGWVGSVAEADALLAAGAIEFASAQSARIVTPLAAVVGPGTPLFEIVDLAGLVGPQYAPVSTVRGPDTRFGRRDLSVLGRLAERDGPIVAAFSRLLARDGPIPLLPIAHDALAGGDDLHHCTAAATALLAARVRAAGEAALADALDASPMFFLTPWMAACRQILSAAEHDAPPTWVVRAGGNGEAFGVTLAGAPEDWVTTGARPPEGPRSFGVGAGARIAGAIGDSAVIDLLGFGGQRLPWAPGPRAEIGGWLPGGFAGEVGEVFAGEHPGFDPPVPIVVDARRVVETGVAPVSALAMLAADGRGGLVGRGVYRPGVALFARALARQAEARSPI